jgi:hypothetical protein
MMLLQEIDSLPLEFVKEVINFVGFLKNKSGEEELSGGEPGGAESGDVRDICTRELDSIPVAFVREVIDFVSFLKRKQTP